MLSELLGRGFHTGVAIDGIAGIFTDAARSHSQPAVVMSRRKGVCRLAKRHGVPLVPIWFFVSRRPLRNAFGASGEWLSRVLKVSLVLPYGRFGRGGPPVPRRAAITAVVGTPIEVGPACETPSEETIDAIHEQLIAGMRATFDVHKAGECDLLAPPTTPIPRALPNGSRLPSGSSPRPSHCCPPVR